MRIESRTWLGLGDPLPRWCTHTNVGRRPQSLLTMWSSLLVTLSIFIPLPAYLTNVLPLAMVLDLYGATDPKALKRTQTLPPGKHTYTITQTILNRISRGSKVKYHWSTEMSVKHKSNYVTSCLKIFPCPLLPVGSKTH